ncbi:MAG: histidine phosphatase family protein, partial [Thermoplasmata archaeon]
LPPRPAAWVVSPLVRTQRTAAALFAAGYPEAPFEIEPDLIEQCLGDWQGLGHSELPRRLSSPPHAFWPLSAFERPPHGESIADVIARVGPALERLALRHQDQDVIVIGHGGAIRAAVAHALGIDGSAALGFSIQNLSLTRLECTAQRWRVVSVNELLVHPSGEAEGKPPQALDLHPDLGTAPERDIRDADPDLDDLPDQGAADLPRIGISRGPDLGEP